MNKAIAIQLHKQIGEILPQLKREECTNKAVTPLTTSLQFLVVVQTLLDRAIKFADTDVHAANVAYFTAFITLEEYMLVWPLKIKEYGDHLNATMDSFHATITTENLRATFLPSQLTKVLPTAKWNDSFKAFKDAITKEKLIPSAVTACLSGPADSPKKSGRWMPLSRKKSPDDVFTYRPELPAEAHTIANQAIANFLQYEPGACTFNEIYPEVILALKPFLLNPQAEQSSRFWRVFSKHKKHDKTEKFVHHLLLLYFQLLRHSGQGEVGAIETYKQMRAAFPGAKLAKLKAEPKQPEPSYITSTYGQAADEAHAAAKELFTSLKMCPVTGLDDGCRVTYAHPTTDRGRINKQAAEMGIDGFVGDVLYVATSGIGGAGDAGADASNYAVLTWSDGEGGHAPVNSILGREADAQRLAKAASSLALNEDTSVQYTTVSEALQHAAREPSPPPRAARAPSPPPMVHSPQSSPGARPPAPLPVGPQAGAMADLQTRMHQPITEPGRWNKGHALEAGKKKCPNHREPQYAAINNLILARCPIHFGEEDPRTGASYRGTVLRKCCYEATYGKQTPGSATAPKPIDFCKVCRSTDLGE